MINSILISILIGGLIGVFNVLSFVNNTDEENKKLLFLFRNFILGTFLFGIPTFFVYISCSDIPIKLIGLACCFSVFANAKRLTLSYNLPSFLFNNSLLRLLLVEFSALINFLLILYFIFSIFTSYEFYGFAHILLALLIANILSRANTPIFGFFTNSYLGMPTTAIIFSYIVIHTLEIL